MRTLLWLFAQVVWLLVQFVLAAILEIVRCTMRLLYWTVRTYGWGRVGSFLGAVVISLWLHAALDRLAFTGASMGSLTVSTLAVWVGLWVGGRWLVQRGRQWLTSARQAAASSLPHADTGSPPRAPEGVPASVPSPSAASSSSSPPSVEGRGLWEQILSLATLQEAWRRVLVRQGSPGSDGMTVEAFAVDADRHLRALGEDLAEGRYRPRPPRWIDVPKRSGGLRKLAVLCIRDRLVQQAVHSVLVPLWDQRFAPCSFAYRPGRSALQAVAAVERALALGRVWVVDADIEAFFDSVPHPPLLALLTEWLPDERVRALMHMCVATTSPMPGKGLAQGAPLSPLLANLYLHRFDTALLQAGHHVVRYADDFVIPSATRQQAEAALQMAERLLQGLGLRLNPEKTHLVHRDEGLTFLGYTFTRHGKRPSEEALASLQARLAAVSDEPTRRQILVGWQGYFGEGAAVSSPTSGKEIPAEEPVEALHDDTPWWEEIEALAVSSSVMAKAAAPLSLYQERFVGRSDMFARFWQKNGRKGYAPVRRPMTEDDLRAHLAGEDTLGTYLLHPDGTTKALVLDIDGPNVSEERRVSAFHVAQRLVTALHRQGIMPLWMDSGGKGYHLWLCFSEPLLAKALRQWMNRWLDRFRPFPQGVLVEVFPKQDSLAPNALGALLRLPLGRHPETGRPGLLLTPEGQPVTDPWATLATVPLVNGQALLQSVSFEPPALPEPPEAIAPVVRGCALVRGLVRKAVESHHLRHTERLALLYTLGHLGEAGQTYLHQVIGLCSNYDSRITQRWIQRMDEGHKPIRCATLREWLKDHLPGVTCPCVPKRANPSPLDLLRRAEPPTPSVSSAGPRTPAWDEVAQEMFGEALFADDGTCSSRRRKCLSFTSPSLGQQCGKTALGCRWSGTGRC